MRRWFRRLAPVLVAAFLVVLAVAARNTLTAAPIPQPPTTTTPATTASAAPTTTASTTTRTATPAATTNTGSDDDAGAAPATVEAIATRFMRTYLSGTTVPHAQWLAALRPLVADRLYVGFVSTDPANLPTGALGTVRVISTTADGGVARVNVGALGLVLSIGSTPAGTIVVVAIEEAP